MSMHTNINLASLPEAILREILEVSKSNIAKIKLRLDEPDAISELLTTEEVYHMLLMVHALAKDMLRAREDIAASRKMNETLRNDVKKLTEELKGR